MNIREVIQIAQSKKQAIGHFNFSTLDGLWAAFGAAKSLGMPVIVGTSEGERDFVGVRQAAALVKSLREEYQYPIFLNADHTYSLERVEEAVSAGYDAVIFDGAQLSLEENIAKTKECVLRAKGINPDILVEGELGYIGTSSKLLDELPEGASASEDAYTKPEEAKRFVTETGVDLFAPAVGNIHGMLRHAENPRLSIDRIRAICGHITVPLVLHGGSGTSDEDFRSAIEAGVAVVHINTELRLTFRTTLEKTLLESPDEIVPYRIMKRPKEATEEVIRARISLFSGK